MCSRLLKLTFARFFCPESFLDALFIILRSNEVPYPAPLGVFLFFTWASSHHAAVAGDCLSIIVTSSANVREVQQTEANFLERLLPKMRCSKCIPRAAYSCFLETVEKAWKRLYMTMQHHAQQNIILAQGAALCKKYSARQHDSPWLNTTVHCTDCRKLQYARWNH